MYQILIHIINLRDPEKSTKWSHGFDKGELLIADNPIDMKNHGLHQSFEMLSNKAILVLHHICSLDGWDIQSIYIGRLQKNDK